MRAKWGAVLSLEPEGSNDDKHTAVSTYPMKAMAELGSRLTYKVREVQQCLW